MEIFNVIAGVASIISLLLSIFAVTQVVKIKSVIKNDSSVRVKRQTVTGNGNVTSGRDSHVG